MKILSNGWMQEEAEAAEKRRRHHLSEFKKKQCGGSLAELMRLAGRGMKSNSHLQGVLAGTKPFGEKLARNLEIHLKLPPMYLDRPIKSVLPPDAIPQRKWPFSFTQDEIESLDPLQRQRIEDTIRGMLSGFGGLPGDTTKKKRAAGETDAS